jgi:hypothetical protein
MDGTPALLERLSRRERSQTLERLRIQSGGHRVPV